jgi:predicted permease
VDTLLQDIRFSLRDLMTRPGFTAVAVLTLAIAIGANTAMFSIVNATLLRRLPFSEPDRLMAIHLVLPKSMAAEMGRPEMVWSYPKYETFRAAQRAFADLALYEESEMSLTGREQPERLTGEAVGATYFRTLGIVPQVERGFLREEDSQPGTRTVVVLGHALWTRQFAADPRVAGTLVKLDGKPYTIVGVAPPTFKGLTGTAEYWVPVMARPAELLSEAFSHEFDLVGRLAPGITPEQAASQVAALGRLIEEAHPAPIETNRGWGAMARPLEAERIDPSIERGVLVLFAAVGFVLLIACANLANLQLARAESRRGEVAVRLAVGASRRRLIRQLLTESLVLALAGAMAGVLLAWLCLRALSAIDPGGSMTFGRPLEGLSSLVLSSIRIDGTAFVFTLLAATATAVLFGLVPALRATRVEVCDALRGVEEAERGRRIRPLAGRGVLVSAQIALTLMLLIAAGLTIKSLARLLGTSVGFDPRHVLTVRVSLPEEAYAGDASTPFFTELLERMRAIPGVTSAALGNCPPLAGGCNGTVITFPDRPPVPEGQEPPVGVHFISPGYLRTLRVPLLRGRDFTPSDRQGAPKVVLVNETAARRFWPGENPVGKRVGVFQGGFHDGAEVVGVVGDMRFKTAEEPPEPDVFISYDQAPRRSALVYLRTAGKPEALVGEVRRAVASLDRSLPIYDIKPMTERAAAATARSRYSAILLAAFAAIALILAAVGVYGVTAYDVTQRTREIGIRMALGAERRAVLALILRQGLAMTLAGTAFGLAGAYAATRGLRALLYGVTPTDPATFFVVTAVMATVATAACVVPAGRAMRINPLAAIRRP